LPSPRFTPSLWLIFGLLGFWIGSESGALAAALLGGMLGYLLNRVSDLQRQVSALEAQLKYAPGPSVQSDSASTTSQPKATQEAEPAFEPGMAPTMSAPADPREAAAEPFSTEVPTEALAKPRAKPIPEPAPGQSTWNSANPPRQVPSPTSWLSQVLSRLLAGNLLAKLGIVVLFFGVASGLKLAADQGMFPPWTRLMGAALAGLAFIWAGAAPATGQAFRPAWLFRLANAAALASPSSTPLPTRIGFGLALEGGGFGLLYLAVYFALDTYSYIAPATAFLLFAGLGVACLTLALRQEGQALALLGLSGAFMAPVLAGGEGKHLMLFAYIVLLDVFILWASLRRAWRGLILAGFGFSVILGLAWADASYQPALQADVAGFVVVLLALFSLTPVLAARQGNEAKWGWQSATLLFGPPAAAAAAQSSLFYGELVPLALSSLLTGLWYGLLWLGARRTGDDLLARALGGLAIAFLSLSPYLAFSQNIAGVFWALEGAGLIWYGRRLERRFPMAAGALLQVLSGLLLLDLWIQGPDGVPFRNSLFHASLLLAAAGAFSAFALGSQGARRAPRVETWTDGSGFQVSMPKSVSHLALPARLFLLWALVWWLGIWFWELGYVLNDARRLVAMLLVTALTALGTELAGRRWSMPDARAASMLLLPALAAAPVLIQLRLGHPLAANLWLVLPVALAVHFAVLRRQESDGLSWYLPERHTLGLWAVAWIPAWELAWQAAQYLEYPALGYSLAEALRGAGLALPLLLALHPGGFWPLGPHRPLYLRQAMALPVLLAWLWLFTWPVAHTGAWSLPYIPLLNPLEGAAVLVLWSLHRHGIASDRFGLPQAYAGAYNALFPVALLAWLTQALARSVHHFSGVPYTLDTLWQSALFQALVSLAWAAAALATMVLASRRQGRIIWFGGLALLSLVGLKLLLVDLASVSGLLRVLSLMGVGLLVLGAGYLAPVPPRSSASPDSL
jgi:uncharacterized membrane protein